jgi:imidazoleglycerol-phosphate dehydratase
MIQAMTKLAGFDIVVSSEGDAQNCARAAGRAMGSAIDSALCDRSGIKRYGFAVLPMDEASSTVALDLSGRPYFVIKGRFNGSRIGDTDVESLIAFLEELTIGARMTLNVRFDGENDHHQAESIFKALGLSFRAAVLTGGQGILSTKGLI